MKKVAVMMVMAIVFYACKKTEQHGKTPLAKVGNIVITEEELKSQLPELASQFMEEEQKSQILNFGIEATVFYLAAKDEGLFEDQQIKDKIRWMERLLIADEYLKRKVQSDITVTQKEIEDFYNRYKSEFQKQIDIAYVIGKRKEDVEKARKRMLQTTPVRAITEFQKNPDLAADILQGLNVGGLRIYPSLPQEMIDVIFSIRVGDVSEIIQIAPDQYGFIRILDETKAKVTKEEVMENIKSFLLVQKAQIKKDSIFNVLKEKYKVEILNK